MKKAGIVLAITIIVISVIAILVCIGAIFISEGMEEGLFTLLLGLFVIGSIIIKYIIPVLAIALLIGIIVYAIKKKKKKVEQEKL